MALEIDITQNQTTSVITDAYCRIKNIVLNPKVSVDIYVSMYNGTDAANTLQPIESRLYNCIVSDACWDTYFSETTLKVDGDSLTSNAYNFLKTEEIDFANSTDV